MYCPDCKRRLAEIAESCRCGWTKGNVVEGRFVHCAHQDCPDCAVSRVKTATGYANFCPRHYEAHFADEARMYCLSRGLDTKEKQLAYCKETISKMRRRIAA